MIRYSPTPIEANKNVSILICHRNTLENITLCVSSILTHYPDIEIHVLDGMSDDYSRTWLKTREQIYPHLHIHDWTTDYHSHGVMMDHGIKNVIKTPYVWLMDSDVIVRYRVRLPDVEYATGTLMVQSKKGEGCTPGEGEDSFRYIHPSCCILDRSKYQEYAPFTDHGAPCVWNMIEANEAGEVLRDWPEGNASILHLCGGSWTTPRTVWWHDMGVQTRPLVSWLVPMGLTGLHHVHVDSEVVVRTDVGLSEEDNIQIVGWLQLQVMSDNSYWNRMRVRGEYVTSQYVSHEEIEELAQSIIQHGAQETFGPFTRRDVWQRNTTRGKLLQQQ